MPGASAKFLLINSIFSKTNKLRKEGRFRVLQRGFTNPKSTLVIKIHLALIGM